MGLWYELIHYPSWFQRNDNYNTTAEYTLNSDGTVKVHNSTISNGCKFESYGVAKNMGGVNFRVDFPMPEVAKLAESGEFSPANSLQGLNLPDKKQSDNSGGINYINYVIDHICLNECGEYLFAVVTDLNKQSLYVLSRYKHPPITAYNELIRYVILHYNRDRLVQTAQFD